jgi:hypothetical protein
MEEKDTEKKTYEKPTLVKHGELAAITRQDGEPTVGSGVVTG